MLPVVSLFGMNCAQIDPLEIKSSGAVRRENADPGGKGETLFVLIPCCCVWFLLHTMLSCCCNTHVPFNTGAAAKQAIRRSSTTASTPPPPPPPGPQGVPDSPNMNGTSAQEHAVASMMQNMKIPGSGKGDRKNADAAAPDEDT